jgi:hypothetical protein
MKIQQRTTKILSTIVAMSLWVTPEIASAAQQQNSQPATQSQGQQQPSTGQAAPNDAPPAQNQQNRGTTVDPTQAPLQPVTTYPEAPTPQQDQGQTAPQQPQTTITTTVPAPPEQKPVTEPVGAAAAEKVPTAGGAASKPAGAAIAPAKQHQTRSLLIKIGAIAAGGLAAGTIYALSHGTSSKPPNTGTTGVTQK